MKILAKIDPLCKIDPRYIKKFPLMKLVDFSEPPYFTSTVDNTVSFRSGWSESGVGLRVFEKTQLAD